MPPTETPALSQLPLPPGSTGYPLLGETLTFLRAPRKFIQERRLRYGNVFRTHLFGSPTAYLVGSEAARWVFAGENKYLHARWSAGTRRVLPTHSTTILTGEAHQERRRLLAPHFTQAHVRASLPPLQAIALRHLARWAERPGPLTLLPLLSTLVFEVALGLILSDAQVDPERTSRLFQTWTKGLFTAVPWDVPFTTHGRSLAAKRELISLLEPLVAERGQRAEQPQDILGSLLSVRDDEGRPLPREAVIDEVLLQLLAGHDTTMHSLLNMVFLLAQHPEVRERCREEQQGASLEEPLTLESLRAMPRLHQFIQEALRLHPPAGGVSRVTTQEVEFGGYRIPQGWTVMFGISGTQRMEPWTEPERFDPERMSPERAEHKRQPHCHVPFGGGARVCLGQHFALAELGVVLSLLLRGYRWELVPGQDLEFTPIPFPHPRSGVVVEFSRR
jgi:cytochrome P450